MSQHLPGEQDSRAMTVMTVMTVIEAEADVAANLPLALSLRGIRAEA